MIQPQAQHLAGSGRRRGARNNRHDDDDTIQHISDHIGARIRARRTELGITQEQLAAALGVSYQQVQKYETAANRISAGRLYALARACHVDTSYFFDGLEGATTVSGLPHGGTNRTAIDLVRNFLALEDDALRGAVAGLLKALREQHDGGADHKATSS